MARRWTPQRFLALRRIRVVACAVIVTVACVLAFFVTTRKTVTLDINGKTTTVQTNAMSVNRLLQEQNIAVKTHDIVRSTSGDMLSDHAVVTMQSAYQATINIEGQDVPFWTVATSADQLLGFFKDNEKAASKVTVDIKNVYNQLTGGFIINKQGPVTVVADGKSSEAPNGKLTAASILDSKGIVLGKEDRVSVENTGGSNTVLRVQRVTHGETTKTIAVPFETQTIVDSSLEPGETVVRQEGQAGEKKATYNTTFVDGKEETSILLKEQTTKIAIDKIVAVGPEKPKETPKPSESASGSSSSNANSGKDSDSDSSTKPSSGSSASSSAKPSQSATAKPTQTAKPTSKPTTSKPTATAKPTQTAKPTSKPTTAKPTSKPTTAKPTSKPTTSKPSTNTGSSSGSGLWHPSAAAAQTYAKGAAAQRGWTGSNWTNLVALWNRESSWQWNAENPYSGAYGIPQSLPGSKMAAFGANWRDDASVQINWGLSYIAQRYGSPNGAWAHSQSTGWY
ncbi:G5 domain-containing protein [Bifidobacterium primatium]|uniref:G5 domain-containing protein n=1 Tax=Bifidobacterium primatium TaxID=2045438 RepID=A0A2M9HBP5_9BIFI|nr:G5 domain-containing protein [Bifidobacterium primatium]PJM74201.1 G5 domain-containing protein [Bifidobacterium primatium]